MNRNDLPELAMEMGFAAAALIETKDIEFIPAFRPLCEENLCGKYGVNYACPPDCGTVEEMKARVRKWPMAVVLQTVWDVDDPMDGSETKPAKGKHNKLTREFIDRTGLDGLMVGASGCNLCETCAIVEGKPCRFPKLMFSCMSAYCIFVKDMADKCGMEYDYGPNTVALFSMFCFDGKKQA